MRKALLEQIEENKMKKLNSMMIDEKRNASKA